MTSNGYYYGRIRISFNVQVYAEILYYSAVTNSWTTLVLNGISASSKGTIQFDTSGDSLALFYNGQSVAAVQDASLGEPGGVGVYTESNDTGYSNFEVNAEPSSSANTGLPFSDNFARGTGAFIGSDWTVNAGDFDLNDNLLVAAVSNSNSLVVVNGASTVDAEVVPRLWISRTPGRLGGAGWLRVRDEWICGAIDPQLLQRLFGGDRGIQ